MMQQQGFVVSDVLEIKNLNLSIVSDAQNSHTRKWHASNTFASYLFLFYLITR